MYFKPGRSYARLNNAFKFIENLRISILAEETAEEAAQRVIAERLSANRESKKRKCAEESLEQRENMFASQREITNKNRAEESQEQRENRFAAQRNITKSKPAEEVSQRVNSKRKSRVLLPFSGENHKFLPLYFIGDRNSARCEIFPDVERTIVSQKQHLFHENNNLLRLFNTVIDFTPIDTH